MVITQDFVKGQWFEQYIKVALDFFRAQGVNSVVEVRKRFSLYKDRFKDTGIHKAPISKQREFMIRDPSWGRRADPKNTKMYKTMCIFFELPTRQCLEKILMAIKHNANYIRVSSSKLIKKEYLKVKEAGKSSYIQTSKNMKKLAFLAEKTLAKKWTVLDN